MVLFNGANLAESDKISDEIKRQTTKKETELCADVEAPSDAFIRGC